MVYIIPIVGCVYSESREGCEELHHKYLSRKLFFMDSLRRVAYIWNEIV